MEIAVVWIVLSFVAAAVANGKGRSGTGFFFLSVLLSPLIGLIAAFAARPNVRAMEGRTDGLFLGERVLRRL